MRGIPPPPQAPFREKFDEDEVFCPSCDGVGSGGDHCGMLLRRAICVSLNRPAAVRVERMRVRPPG